MKQWRLVWTVLMALSPLTAFGWGAEAHETIALLAERRIAGTRAAAEVRKLLRPGETMAVASTWADRIKREGFDQESNDFIARNPFHATYHYTDIPFQSLEYRSTLLGARPDDVVHILTRCIEILRGKADAKTNPTGLTRRVALLLLIHMVGDISQPFHVGSGYIANEGGVERFIDPRTSRGLRAYSDIGGNSLIIGAANLHYFWDVIAVQRAMQQAVGGENTVAYAEWIASHVIVHRQWKGRAETWPWQWATSILPLCREMRTGISLGLRVDVPNPHPPPPFRNEWTIQLPAGYEGRAVEAVNSQLAQAGYDLAKVLQAIWPDAGH